MAIRPKLKRMPLKRPISQRVCSFLLALAFIWDIGFHLIASPHGLFEASGSTTEITPGGGGDMDPDCGVPGHGCALSHHHHFPALVTTSQFLIAPVALTSESGALPTVVAHRSISSRLIRAPPFAL